MIRFTLAFAAWLAALPAWAGIEIQQITSPKGIQAWLVEEHSIPFTALQVNFKGGTSLSKAYHVIRRFSEDVDLTYDIRAIAPDLVGENGEAQPKNRSEEKRWSSRQVLAASDLDKHTSMPWPPAVREKLESFLA